MKRLLFGFAAIVFAGAMAAFTTPVSSPSHLPDAFFAFDYSYSPTKANVEDESKWIKVADMNGCDGSDFRACKIRVTDAHYSGSSLSSSANIQALESATGIAYVDDAVAVAISNRSNP